MSDYFIEKRTPELEKDGFELFLQHCDTTEARTFAHIHAAAELLFIEKGEFRVVSEAVELVVHPGEVVLFRPNTIHEIYPMEANTAYYVLKLSPDFVLSVSDKEKGAEHLKRLSLYGERVKLLWSREECRKNGMKRLQALLAEAMHATSYASDVAVRAYAAAILSVVLKEVEPPAVPVSLSGEVTTSDKIYESLLYLNEHFGENVTAEKCAASIYMSYGYFIKRFKRVTGKTVRAYLLDLRLAKAEKELLTTNKPILEIALSCGFSSHAYFSSLYKEAKGLTPTEARALSQTGRQSGHI